MLLKIFYNEMLKIPYYIDHGTERFSIIKKDLFCLLEFLNAIAKSRISESK
jgi:hypothetical protein